jgi:hypothetical protein
MVFLNAPYAKPDDSPSEWRVGQVPDAEREVRIANFEDVH